MWEDLPGGGGGGGGAAVVVLNGIKELDFPLPLHICLAVSATNTALNSMIDYILNLSTPHQDDRL